MRRRVIAGVGEGWWALLGTFGLTRARWRELPRIARRAVKAVLWLVVGLLLIAFLGVWEWSALAIAAVVLVLVVPDYGRITVRGRRVGRFIVPAAVLVLAATYPFYASSQGDVSPSMPQLPIFGPVPQMSTMVGMAVFSIMALGLNFVVGYAGLLDLGYVAFYAMGSYTAGWFASSQFSKQNVYFGAIGVTPGLTGFHFSIWLVLLMAGIATAVIGILIGLPTLRLRGDYLAIVTLGFGEILPQIARNGDNLFGTGFNLTNGTGGITPIDPPGFGSWLHHHVGLPANFLTLGTNSDRAFFWCALILVLLTIFASSRLRDSRLGRAWIAIREDEVAAAAMGVPLMRTKTWAYATGAFFGGVAGAYYASYVSGAFPDSFFFQISVFILCMVILGGMGNIWGVIFGACFLTYLNLEGLSNIGGWLNNHFGPGGSDFELWHKTLDVPEYAYGIYGLILVIVMLFRPEGLIPSSRRAAEFHEGVHDQPLYDAAA
ncbi:MAG TPA: branched-chain amino acid ABC transporter permease [Gaiellaceae bacterium]|nr:branched-chain amino acid ABC transporter permease [Gaiellaceae bacterium]